MDSPERAASLGRQGSRDVSSRALNPRNVRRQRLSTPPTTAASQTPERIHCQASAKTLLLDAQAAETVVLGPVRFR
jgi:hypothetical protein